MTCVRASRAPHLAIASSGSSAMTADRLRHVLDALLTCDGRGAPAKGELLMELVDHARGGECPPLRGEIALSVAGTCMACSTRGHQAHGCPSRKR